MSERVYTSREVAAELGLGAAMLRRYASTYEAVSGEEITIHRRDGRLFTGKQLEVLMEARALVMRTNTDVETAIKQALEQPVTGDIATLTPSSALDTATLLQALTEANKAATQPLLDEVKLLREQVEQQMKRHNDLIAELVGRQLEQGEQPAPVTDETVSAPSTGSTDPRPGVFVKAAQRLERWLYKKG